MDWILFRAKALRILHRILPIAWEEFLGPLFNRGQMLAFLISLIGTALIMQRGDFESMDAEISSWSVAVQAFGYVLIIWAVISTIRAPILIVSKDRERGRWHGRRYVYHSPLLVHTARCKATGEIEMYRFHFTDAEPNSFVYYSVQTDAPASGRVGISVDGVVMMSDVPFGQMPSAGQFGIRIGKDRGALLRVKMMEGTNSITVRIYCHDFSVGNGDDNDGQIGDHKFTL